MLDEGRDLAGVLPAGPSNSCEKLTEPWDYIDASADIPASLVPDDALVARCLGDLLDDWQRKGGRLSYDDVTRMSTKRQLDGRQLASLLQGLVEVGVSVSGLMPLPGELPGDDSGPENPVDAPSANRDALGMYLAEIGRYPLLWAEDEVRLGRLIKAGQDADAALAEEPIGRLKPTIVEQLVRASEVGRDAHDDLVLANLRLVVSIAKLRRYEGSGVELIDRIQDGNLGLMRAADKFDYSLGYKFSTYASWWIRQSIERGIADKSRVVRLPVHVHDALNKVTGTQHRLKVRYDREPTVDELASETGVAAGTVRAILDWTKPVDSLDRVLVGDGDLTYGDLLSEVADIDGREDPAEVFLKAACVRDIKAALEAVLDPRSALVIARRFGLGTDTDGDTLDAIGQDLGLTRERIRQIEVKALDTVTEVALKQGLYEYLVTDTKRHVARPPADWAPPGTGRQGKKAARIASGSRRQGKGRRPRQHGRGASA